MMWPLPSKFPKDIQQSKYKGCEIRLALKGTLVVQ